MHLPAESHKPVEQATSGLAVKEGHRQPHDLGQKVGMQPARGIEGAQDQQQCSATLYEQRYQAQGEVDGHVLAAVDVQALLFQPGRLIRPDAEPPVLPHLYTPGRAYA